MPKTNKRRSHIGIATLVAIKAYPVSAKAKTPLTPITPLIPLPSNYPIYAIIIAILGIKFARPTSFFMYNKFFIYEFY